MTLRRPEELEDEKRIARDGEIVRRPMMLADSSFGFDDVDHSEPQEVFDSYGNRPGNRPGPVFANKPAPFVTDDTARNVAYDVYDACTSAAWRRPGEGAPARAADSEAAYERYEQETQDAWRKRGAR